MNWLDNEKAAKMSPFQIERKYSDVVAGIDFTVYGSKYRSLI